MKGKLIRHTLSDGLILQGLLCRPEGESDVCTIHIHGSTGNFYENFFLDDMQERYNKRGFAFLSVSTRGRDYYSDLKFLQNGKYGSKQIGGIKEIFSDSKIDISGWVECAESLGYKRIYLQGHSLGAMKVVYYATLKESVHIDGLVLISPPDLFGLQEKEYGDRFIDDLKLAKKHIDSGEPEKLMPEGCYYDPITAASFYNLFSDPDKTGMFSYDSQDRMKRSLITKIPCSTLVIFCTDGEAVTIPVPECEKIFRKYFNKDQRLDVVTINRANHSYHFKEKELSSVISRWLIKKTERGH